MKITILECIAIYVDGEFVTVNGKDLLNKISLYPNPTNGIITVSSENVTIKSVEVFNSLGNKLNNINLINSNIDLSVYANGLYYIRIIGSNDEDTTFKVIKE